MSKILKNIIEVIVVIALLLTTVFSGVPALRTASAATSYQGSSEYFTVQFTEANGITPVNGTVKLGLSESGISAGGTMEVSYNKGLTWEAIEKLATATSIETNPIMFRGKNIDRIGTETESVDSRWVFTPSITTGRTRASGNIDTLLDYRLVEDGIEPSKSTNTYAFMFVSCDTLIETPELPSTALKTNCYSYMFSYCPLLKKAPELPARILKDGCYKLMFYNCNSLITAPELPAKILAPNCYNRIFYNCSSLKEAPELPATILAENCSKIFFRSRTLEWNNCNILYFKVSVGSFRYIFIQFLF